MSARQAEGLVLALSAGAIALAVSMPFDSALAAPELTEQQACDVLKQRVAESRQIPVSSIAFCDVTVPDFTPAGLYVIGLHSNWKCTDLCSTLMGWFAVRKVTGEVFDFDIIENKPASPIPKP
jgi:hypothetical protein